MVSRVGRIIGAGLLVGTLQAHAAGILTATHFLDTAAPMNSGVEISLEIEIKNTGDTPITDVVVSPASSDLFLPAGATSFALDNLDPGQSETLTFTVATTNSPAIFAGSRPLAFSAHARDTFGVPLQLDLVSASKR